MNENSMPKSLVNDVEPFFECADSSNLVMVSASGDRVLEYLCHSISRNPEDLRSHVRRILIEYQTGQSETLYAALVDLFLVLRSRGLALRTRLLEMAKPRLEPGQYGHLKASLAPGLAEAETAHINGSLLAQGEEGSFEFAQLNREETRSTANDPLVLARQFLEYSQVEEARDILEKAILEQPNNAEVQKELVEIYRATRDKRRFTDMTGKLADNSISILAEWRELASYFGSSNG